MRKVWQKQREYLMHNSLKFLVMATAIVSATPAHAAPAPVTGKWITTEGDSVITISQCGKTVCGRISKILVTTPDANLRDVNNPNPKLRSRSIVGLPILTQFKPDGKKWRGKIYDPRNGKQYRSILTLLKNGKLKVEGCIAFFCQSQYWTRAK
jgi:uncharacterized protein (DUF2147 family)